MIFRSRVARLRMLLVIGTVGSCSSGGTDSTGGNNNNSGTLVQALPSIAFSPVAITIDVGGTVRWAFGSVGHTVTFDPVTGHPGDIPGPITNTSVSRTFTTAGTFPYHCSIHPSMTGSVQVGQSISQPPPPPPPPPPPYGGGPGQP